MADYTQTTDFSAKDALASGDPNKTAKGSDIDTELSAISTAIATKMDASRFPNVDGNVTATDEELNILDGVTASTAEINLLDGVTSLGSAIKDHGTVATNTAIDLADGDLHIIECGANLTLTISSSNTNDKGTICIHNNGSYTISLSGIDNDSPTLTVGTNVQDFIGLIKSHGKITCVATNLNQTAV